MELVWWQLEFQLSMGFQVDNKTVNSESDQQHGDVTMTNNTDARLDIMQVQVDSTEKVVNAGLSVHKAELEGYKLHADGRFDAVLAQLARNRKVEHEKFWERQKQMAMDQKVADEKFWERHKQMAMDRKVADEKFWERLKQMDAKHEAMIERMDAKHEAMIERMDAKHEAMNERIDADRREADAKHEAMLERMDGSRRALEDKIESSANSIKLWVIIALISSLAGGAGLVAAGISIVNGLSGG